MRITGSRTSVPTSRNACVLYADAASHRVKRYGTIIGHRLIAMPRYDITKSRIAAANGDASEFVLSERPSHHAITSVRSGTGESQATFGHENQRRAVSSALIG